MYHSESLVSACSLASSDLCNLSTKSFLDFVETSAPSRGYSDPFDFFWFDVWFVRSRLECSPLLVLVPPRHALMEFFCCMSGALAGLCPCLLELEFLPEIKVWRESDVSGKSAHFYIMSF